MSAGGTPPSQQHGDANSSRASRGGPVPGQFPEQVIGSYVIGETVGRGSFGKVKRGRHIHTGEPVAIKILNRLKLKSANMDKKIHREIEILQLFSHPNICRLYEVISTPTDMYLIMEYIEGGELYDYIVQKGHVRESEARYIFQQMVCALEYCHHFRVVHRDLKPENILLGPGLQVKLIDFGLSNIMKDGEFLTTSCGSPNYAAPEVISGKLYFGPEVDVWSCGVILYALLYGCLPFDEDSIPVLFSKIKKGKYSFPTKKPSGPRALIQQILLVDPLVRLTIPQIRDNPWFNQRLPMRLSFTESLFAAQEDRIISVLASDTAKRLSTREKEVRRELERGAGPAYVAYNILLDARRKREIAAEVRELGVADDMGSGSGSGSGGSASNSTPMQPPSPEQQISFEPRATERELNLGLMLSPSPAMESMLEHGDAGTNKLSYNTGSFVPASAQSDGRSSNSPSFPSGMPSSTASVPLVVGSFSMKKRRATTSAPSQNSLHSPDSWRGGTSSSLRRTGLSASAASQLGASLTDQPRVGSVARKHAMYTAEEEQFYVENNCGWRVGLMTDWTAERAFQTVYAVLKAYRMEWKVLSPFRLVARSTDGTWLAMDQQDRGGPRTCSAGASITSSPIPIGGGGGSAVIPFGGAARQGGVVGMEEGERALGGRSRDDRHVYQSHRYGRGIGSSGSPGSLSGGAGHYFSGADHDSSSERERGGRVGSPLSTHDPGSVGSMGYAEVAAVAAAAAPALPPSVPPAESVVLCMHLLRIHERHDKGFLVDFSVRRNVLVSMDLVCRISNELIHRVS